MLALAGLFVTAFVFFYLVFCPGTDETSVAAVTADAIKARLQRGFLTPERAVRLQTIGRTAGELFRGGAVIGGAAAFLAFVVAVRFLGVFALVPAAVAFMVGPLLASASVDYEFRRWQGRVLDGVPNLFNFVPAFLETGVLTPREALALSLPFIPQPLRGLLENAVASITLAHNVKDAMDELAGIVKHPLIDAIAFRLSSAWDVRVDAGIFDDLSGQLVSVREEAAARATAAKASYFVLVAVLGLLGALLLFGYPALKFMMQKLTRGFGV
ncbi:MAG: hypothetical protein IMW96_10955 [Thermoanaerobacteraceae bacterium]|nr:hypothetical protein [Thermoanaerobacteraceae bacterium]